jgi:hypothetical protein
MLGCLLSMIMNMEAAARGATTVMRLLAAARYIRDAVCMREE